MMRQHARVKAQYPGAIVLFRVGDFYETFGEDAVEASRILGITLTKRANGAAADVELAGFPHHALDNYLPKLVKAGRRVAVCDQLEDPKTAKGVVKRGVTDVVSPGMVLTDGVTDVRANNFLAAVFLPQAGMMAAAWADVATGDFFCLSGAEERVQKVLQAHRPAEILAPRKHYAQIQTLLGSEAVYFRLEDWVFEGDYGVKELCRHLGTTSLKGYGLEDEPAGAAAAGALVHYLRQNEHRHLGHLTGIRRFEDEQHLILDKFTVRNLELFAPLHPEGQAFIEIQDLTRTPAGSRMLKRWFAFPLRNLEAIRGRQAQTRALINADGPTLKTLDSELKNIGDLERLVGKLATLRITPRECAKLRGALRSVPKLFSALVHCHADAFASLLPPPNLQEPLALLDQRLADEPGAQPGSGDVIRFDVHPRLDEFRRLKADAQATLDDIRAREARRTQIPSLKVQFNKVFGYYIEISNAHQNKVPKDYIRKQTLANAERYITPELKSFEEKILSADAAIHEIENQEYRRLTSDLQAYVETLQATARTVAQVDAVFSFAEAARKYGYVLPEITDGNRLVIVAGRHPVIETRLPPDDPYIPNDLMLDAENQQIILLTGPNMAGKSALLRQTALIALMAHAGAAVPARAAEVPLTDRIFTRVGASDNLAGGESTFMVEMNETAYILNHATPQSLVLLDEIGRGTGTYDGMAIAWAIVEHLHRHTGAKTIFATHYHELAQISESLPRVKNYNVAVRESDGKIVFLRKLTPGAAERSFGIQVAERAGVPKTVVRRARHLLAHFEAENPKLVRRSPPPQTTLFAPANPIAEKVAQRLLETDVNRLSPVEALLKLNELKTMLERSGAYE
jgi:DNA mismatch repair protein MutS